MQTRLPVWTPLLLAALVTSASSGHAAEPDAALVAPGAVVDKHRSVASDGTPPPPPPVPARAFLPSWSGPTLPASAADAEAERRGGIASRSEVLALLQLPTVRGLVGTESIIGGDERRRVQPTTAYPARATVLVTLSGGRCSGWLIGPDTVATAGHCVHSGGPGGQFYDDIIVYPGRNGALSPYGSCTARRLYTTGGWIDTADDRYDYGAIKLNCRIGKTTGWYGLRPTTGDLAGEPTIISGYPGDKRLTQWRSTDQVRVSLSRRLFYRNDTIGGMSGSPVYNQHPGCGTCAIAVHAYGLYGEPPFSTNNHGARITQEVFDNFVAWRNAS
jgi:glutamyl endopeptidase